jgi:hypothetical protein
VIPLFSIINSSEFTPPVLSSFIHSVFLRALFAALSVCCHVMSVALFTSCLVNTYTVTVKVIWFIFLLGFIGKISMALILFDPAQFFVWCNFSVLLGTLLAIYLLTLFLRLPLFSRAVLTCLMLILSLIMHWLWSNELLFEHGLNFFEGQANHLLSLDAVTHTLQIFWPYGALFILLGLFYQPKRQAQCIDCA